MSYYEGDYYTNPVPYTSSDVGEPVPGWGSTVRIAGPSRVGVGGCGSCGGSMKGLGLVKAPIPYQMLIRTQAPPDPGMSVVDKMPIWVIPAGVAVVLFGVGWYGTGKWW